MIRHFGPFFFGVLIAWCIVALMDSCNPRPCETDMECEELHGPEGDREDGVVPQRSSTNLKGIK